MSNFFSKPDKTNHKVTEDKLVRALHQTRPVGSKQHRDELEARLLGILTEQAQSTQKRQSLMQLEAQSNILALPKIRISPILAATIAMILIGSGLLFAFGSTESPNNSGYGQQVGHTATATPLATQTMVPGVDPAQLTMAAPLPMESCPFAAIGTAQDDIPVYVLDSSEAELLGNFETGDAFMIIGQNYDGDWLVIQWSDEYVGWVETPSTSDASFTIITCDELLETTQDPAYNEMTATALPPTAIPTSTPIGSVDNFTECPNHQVDSVLTLSETIVYVRPDTKAKVVDTFIENSIVDVIGVNFDQDWFVVNLHQDYIGWMPIENTQILGCEVGAGVTELMISPTPIPSTMFPPTVLPPSDSTVTSTPIPTN